MKTIQYQESYSSLMFRKKLKPFLWGLGFLCFLLLLIIGWFFVPWLHQHSLLLFGLISIAIIFLKSPLDNLSEEIGNFRYGEKGEKDVEKRLQETLDDNYIYVANYTIPNTRIGDIDGLLIGPKGIIILEVKNYQGVFRISGIDMFRRLKGDIYKLYRKNPFKQIARQKKFLEKFFKEKGVDIHIMPIVVLVTGVIDTISGETGIFITEINKLINNIFKLSPAPNWSVELSNKILTVLDLK